MSQIKIYGVKEHLGPIKAELSGTVHSCLLEALSFPPAKRFHRFIGLERSDFYSPTDRSDKYTIMR